MSDDPQIVAYGIELDEIYLFPEREHRGLVEEMTDRYPMPAHVIEIDLRERQAIGEWLRYLWARRLEPTSKTFHEVTPILARIRQGAATERERKWFREYFALAIELGEIDKIEVICKLATKQFDGRQGLLINKAAFEYFDQYRRIPTYTELQEYVRSLESVRHGRFESLDEENWNRYLRRSGLSSLFMFRGDVS